MPREHPDDQGDDRGGGDEEDEEGLIEDKVLEAGAEPNHAVGDGAVDDGGEHAEGDQVEEDLCFGGCRCRVRLGLF